MSVHRLVFWLGVLTLSQSALGDGDAIAFETLLKTDKSWDGSRLPSYPTGEPEITILKVSVPAGKTLASHKHPVINAAMILSGEITVYADNNHSRRFVAGDSVVELVDTWHHGVNTGEVPTEILVFYAGVSGVPLSIKQ
jgi:quercetin dioxygenase-like cupin family protein